MADETREWELTVLACLLRNPMFIRDYSEHLTKEHIIDDLCYKYLLIFKANWRKYGKLPTESEFKKQVHRLSLKEGQTSKTEIYRRMMKDVKKIYRIETTEVTRNEIEAFISYNEFQIIGDALPEVDVYDSEKRLAFCEDLIQRVNTIQRMGGGHATQGCYLFDDAVLEETLDTLDNIELAGYRTTGVPRIDALINGLGPGEFAAFIGPSGRGKTAALINVGAANVELGYRVLHISADEPEMQIRQRYITRFTKIPKTSVASKYEKMEAMEELRKNPDHLIIWSVPTETITTKDIHAYVKAKEAELYYSDRKKGIPEEECGKIHLIVIDYATKIKGWMSKNKMGDQSWDRIRYCCEEHQWLARELNIPVVSALQGNKEMATNEFGQLTQIAMGYNAVQALTNAFIICQGQEELHKVPTRLWYFAAKTRNENSLFLVPVMYDKGRQLIWDDEDTDVDYIDSTTNKRAKPKNYYSEEQKAERRAAEHGQANENKDYKADEDEDDVSGYKARERIKDWRQRGIATMEDDDDEE